MMKHSGAAEMLWAEEDMFFLSAELRIVTFVNINNVSVFKRIIKIHRIKAAENNSHYPRCLKLC